MTTPSLRREERTGIGLVLPADWWTLPLTDEDATRRAVVGLVERQVGRADGAAALRRELRVGVTASVRRATAAGGWLMAFMLTRVGELPLPATLTAYRVPGTFATDDGVDAVRGSLTEHAATSGGRLDVGDGPFGLVLRGIRERPVTAAVGAPETPVLVCDYWLDPGDGHGLVDLSFSTPLVALRDGFIDLFDAVVGTLYRVAEPPDGHAPDDDVLDHPVLDQAVLDQAVLDDDVLDHPVLDQAVLDDDVLDHPVLDHRVLDHDVLNDDVVDHSRTHQAVGDSPSPIGITPTKDGAP